MKQNLSAALMDVFGVEEKRFRALEEVMSNSETSLEVMQSVDWQEAAQKALKTFERAQQKQQQGDWAGYGSELKRLSDLLRNLDRLAVKDVEKEKQTESTPEPIPSGKEGSEN